jgi:hydrogenase-4 component F
VATGIGIGLPLATYGALLHSFNHSAAKSLLFFAAGNVRENFGTLRLDRITGMARTLGWTSIFLTVGILAVIGLPPFSIFVSEFAILNAAFFQESHAVVTVVLLALVVGFGALIFQLQRMLAGEPSLARKAMITAPELAAMALCAAVVILFGMYVPHLFTNLIHSAMTVLNP